MIFRPWQMYDAQMWDVAGLPDAIEPERECEICAEAKPISKFPQHATTDGCTHPPNSCAECLQTHIRTELNNKAWHEGVIQCPECYESLAYVDIQQLADHETFLK